MRPNTPTNQKPGPTPDNAQDDPVTAFDATLTPAEIAAPRYLDWSNETLGRCVRAVAEQLQQEDAESTKPVTFVSASTIMVAIAISSNADKLTYELEDVIRASDKKNMGTWVITIQEKKRKARQRRTPAPPMPKPIEKPITVEGTRKAKGEPDA